MVGPENDNKESSMRSCCKYLSSKVQESRKKGDASLCMTSQFIIRLNKHMEAVNNSFTIGMKFKMEFEGEVPPERRVSDFGLAKLLEDEESHITTIVAGTFEYLGKVRS
ncbi:hypothetical protein E3N88_34825 [Mikania micrantha]|uniref:Uncharacterized protein n=1 Tax=Mikania micrantha TaxID=192012 RepID=A0A5N6LZ91_9ASTR|nr:hypothetical protein E3N88_34825 [Mikania micrantha]